ncbi:MAG: alpha/beta fold hydrolase [Gemmatimonadota bacterium]
MHTRYRGLVGAIALLLGWSSGTLAAQQAGGDIPTNPFTRPTGPYRVGTLDWLWIDPARPERYTKDPNDKRHLPVQVWYPADSAPGGEPAPYVRVPEEFGPQSAFKSMEQVKTNAVTGAPVAKGQRKYPVLIYSHGAGWSRFTATFLTEELASHGYVIFSIDHPGLDRTVLFSDGTPFKADTLSMPPQDPKDPRAGATKSMEFLNAVAFPIWLEDSRFVLDEVEKLNRAPGPFQDRLDLDRIGMLGWSFGGATAIEMIRTDPRVKAAVNHDGRLFGGVMTEPTRRPFMLFHHGIDDAALAPEANRPMMREMMAGMRSTDSTARAGAGGDWYDVTIARTNHGSFSDLLLFRKQDTTLVAPRRAHEIISAYTLAFFDRYLKGHKSPLLKRAAPEFPEVAFRRK